jgi:hypothetical protein
MINRTGRWQKAKVNFDYQMYDGVLACPHCGYLHHGDVRTYDRRPEDGEQVLVGTLSCGKATVECAGGVLAVVGHWESGNRRRALVLLTT